MRGTMQALELQGQWVPRSGYAPSADEQATGKARNASAVWKDVRLQMQPRALPTPADDQVVIRVRACGVCGSDTHCYEHDAQGYMLFSGAARLPVTPGHEYAGEVVEVGRSVTGLKVGDAVAPEGILWCGRCTPCRAGHFNQCQQLEMTGFSAPGAFAEYIAIGEKYCWKLDALQESLGGDDRVWELGALIEPIGCAYNGMFVAGGGFQPGAHVAIHGAGPIGLAAVMLARAAGAARIAVFDLNPARNQLARELGADFAASPDELRRQGSSPSQAVRDLTRGQGADLQIEAAGAASSTIPEIQKSFAPNGRMVFLGRHDGVAPVEFNPMVTQANAIVGSRGHAGYGIFPNIIRLLASGRLPAARMITARFRFDDVIGAFDRSSARTDGKIMVRFG